MRKKDWYNHAVETIKQIKEMRSTTPLCLFSSPEEYLEILEDFTKLIYGMNHISKQTMDDFVKLSNSFDTFKKDLILYCEGLILEINKDD